MKVEIGIEVKDGFFVLYEKREDFNPVYLTWYTDINTALLSSNQYIKTVLNNGNCGNIKIVLAVV